MRQRDPLDKLTLAYGILLALMIAARTGEPLTGLVVALLNVTVTVTALLLLPLLRVRRGAVRFFGVTLPLLVFYLFYGETALVLGQPDVVWRDTQVAALELGIWQGLEPTSASGLLGEVMAVAYMSYVPLLLCVAGAMLGTCGAPHAPAEKLVRRVCLAWGICYVLFLLLPVLGPRFVFPDLQAPLMGSGPFSTLARLNQDHGMLRGAAFPSAHIAATSIALWSAWRWRRTVFWWVLPFGVGLAVSAVYLAYHYVTDVIGGILVGVAAVAIDRLVIARSARSDQDGVPPEQHSTAGLPA